MKVYAQQDDNLDAVIYRHLGTSYGLLEKTLLLNPHLAADAVLTVGTPVILPEKLGDTKQVKADSIQLWS